MISDFAVTKTSFTQFTLLYSHTLNSLSLPKASGLWPTAIHSRSKATLCVRLLKVMLLMHYLLCVYTCTVLICVKQKNL